MSKLVDLTGKVFHRLTVIDFAGRDKSRHVIWNCVCTCGTTKRVSGSNLRSGNTHSCGCLHIENNTTHGKTNTPEFWIWADMKTRCANKRDRSYKNYGGRGISVCNEWRESFESFLADMGPRPTPSHSIDRINNEGGYTPENCRWATRKEQNRNTRYCRIITHGGKTMTLVEWAEHSGVNYSTLRARIERGVPMAGAILGGANV